ncbi:MAG: insulinase family protein [Actinomycetota bacterium]|nr:insulinase family protein [Actinomycetota bacterium]
MRRAWIGLLLAASALTACSADAGVRAIRIEPVAAFASGPIPIDAATRVVTLDNGLTVYLRHNDRPGGSASMRLVVNAGSAQETPDQSGVAHFLEHMLFNGTERFPANDLIDVLRGFGMEFGADINAYTSYDETVYELTVPTENRDNLNTGLDVLAQWLSAATLDEQEVVAERGVVLDEWRVRDQTFDGRQGAAFESMLLDGSGYDGRQPIGGEQAIAAMTSAPIRAFYDAWYRPDNAAIVVVGDIDVAEMEAAVHERFDSAVARGAAPRRPLLPVGPFTRPTAVVLADPDTLATTVVLDIPMVAQPVTDTGRIRDVLVLVLAVDMIATRLDDDVTRGEVAFRSASSTLDNPVRAVAATGVALDADPSAVAATVDAVAVEFERVRRYGFDEAELARATEFYRSGLQADFDSADTVADAQYASNFVDHFLEGTSIADATFEYRTYTSMLDSLTAADVTAAFAAHVAASAPHLFVSLPGSAPDQPTVDGLLALLAGMGDRDIQPRAASEAVGDLLMERPAPVEETTVEDFRNEPDLFLDTTRLTFPNGAVVLLNTTDIAVDDVAIEATSPGGLTVVPEADLFAARYATEVAVGSGVGDLDQVSVETVLGGANVSLQAYLADHYEGFSGASTADDLELAFQLIHLYMTAPRFEQRVLDQVKQADRVYIDDPLGDPDFAAYDALLRARFGDSPLYQLVPTAAQQDAVDLATVERTFRDRFRNASDWVFVLSGDFDLDTATELARSYIGTLDGDRTREASGANAPPPPAGVVERTVQAGTGATASLTLLFTEPSDSSRFEFVRADVLTQVLSNRLTDHIREELGASYSPYAISVVDRWPEEMVQTYVSVTGDPAAMTQLAQSVRDVLVDLATNGPSEAELEVAVAAVQREYLLFDNDSVAVTLLDILRDFEESDTALEAYSQLGQLTVADVRQYTARVLPSDHYVQVIQLPG